MTEATCGTRFSRSGGRSMRAASTAWIVATVERRL
jgi:hypothetical protein